MPRRIGPRESRVRGGMHSIVASRLAATGGGTRSDRAKCCETDLAKGIPPSRSVCRVTLRLSREHLSNVVLAHRPYPIRLPRTLSRLARTRWVPPESERPNRDPRQVHAGQRRCRGIDPGGSRTSPSGIVDDVAANLLFRRRCRGHLARSSPFRDAGARGRVGRGDRESTAEPGTRGLRPPRNGPPRCCVLAAFAGIAVGTFSPRQDAAPCGTHPAQRPTSP